MDRLLIYQTAISETVLLRLGKESFQLFQNLVRFCIQRPRVIQTCPLSNLRNRADLFCEPHDTAVKLLGQHQALGSVEGKLQTISERGTLQFVVFDSLYDKGVNCFMDEGIMEQAMQAFRKRVVVTGMVQYDQEGRPVSIRVDNIRVFKDLNELPPIKEFRGLFKKAQ